MFIKISQNNKGFTLIETLVSLLIFSVSIVALVSVTASGVADTRFSQKKQTAYLLAQEGIEMIRYARDSTVRFQGSWSLFLSGVEDCITPEGCDIDTQSLATNGSGLTVVPCAQSQNSPFICSELRRDPLTGFYRSIPTLAPSEVSGFTRKINIEEVDPNSNEELEVISSVSWVHGGRTYSVTMSEVINNWVRPHPDLQP